MKIENTRINERLKPLNKQHEEFLSLVGDKDVDEVLSDATDEKKEKISGLAFNIYENRDNLHRILSDEAHENKEKVETKVDKILLRYYHEKVVPDMNLVTRVLDKTNHILYDFFLRVASVAQERRDTEQPLFTLFCAGIERMGSMSSYGEEDYYDCRPSDMDPHSYKFLLDKAEQILYSEGIRFEPDRWLENARLTRAIMLGKDADLPADAGSRLVEVFRSFIFENWLSVIALSRATMEYVLFDNCWNKWGINPRNDEGRYKDLGKLIEEVRNHDQDLSDLMNFIREQGNKVLHRKKPAKTWKGLEKLLPPKKEAEECIEKLIRAMEIIYLPRGTKKSTNRPPGS